MKRKKNRPPHIEEALELLDATLNPEELYKAARPVARYLQQHSDPELKAIYELSLYPYYLGAKQKDRVQAVFDELKKTGLCEKNALVKGLYNYNASKWAYINAQPKEALEHIQVALDTFKETENKRWQSTALLQLYNCCTTFNISGNYDSIEVLWEAINICNELGLTDEVMLHNYSYACAGIASFYIMEDKHAAALEFLQEPYNKIAAVNQSYTLHIRYLMGMALYYDKNYELALPIFTELYDNGDLKAVKIKRIQLGHYIIGCAMALKILPQYMRYYNESIEEGKKDAMPHNVVESLCLEAQKLAMDGLKKEALATLDKTYAFLVEHKIAEVFYRLYYDSLWRVHETLGDFKAAWAAYRKCEQYIWSSKTSHTDKKIELLQNKVKIARQEKENELLKLELQHQARELELTATFLQRKNDLVDEILTFTNWVSKKHKNQSGLFEIKRKLISIKSEDTERDKLKELLDKNNQAYIKKITEQYPSITNAEAKICALIKIGLGNKEIASLLVTSPRTIDTHRSNIRRKLGLSKTDNLERALREM